jgi:hypothetical protein
MSLRHALVLTGLCSLLTAQVEPPRPGGVNPKAGQFKQVEQVDPSGDAGEADGSTEDGKEAAAKAAFENLTPEERLERSIRSGAGSLCRFVASVRPARLMPGQSGTLYVTAILQGTAVLPAPAPVTVTSAAQQGLVALGAASFQAAKPGRLAQAYLGRPVYDNTATIEIPITMSADAKLGQKQPVHVDLKFDLYDGGTAQVVGRFLDRATAEVEVGLSADPNVAATAKAQPPAAPAGAGAGPATDPGRSDAAAAALGGKPAVGGAAAAASAAPEVAPAVDSEAPGVAPAVGGDSNLTFVLAGGAVLLVLVLLLALRRK